MVIIMVIIVMIMVIIMIMLMFIRHGFGQDLTRCLEWFDRNLKNEMQFFIFFLFPKCSKSLGVSTTLMVMILSILSIWKYICKINFEMILRNS